MTVGGHHGLMVNILGLLKGPNGTATVSRTSWHKRLSSTQGGPSLAVPAHRYSKPSSTQRKVLIFIAPRAIDRPFCDGQRGR